MQLCCDREAWCKEIWPQTCVNSFAQVQHFPLDVRVERSGSLAFSVDWGWLRDGAAETSNSREYLAPSRARGAAAAPERVWLPSLGELVHHHVLLCERASGGWPHTSASYAALRRANGQWVQVTTLP